MKGNSAGRLRQSYSFSILSRSILSGKVANAAGPQPSTFTALGLPDASATRDIFRFQ